MLHTQRTLAVITHYRYERWLGQSIESLLRQSRPVDAIVVVDDASPTPPADIVRRYREVTLLTAEENGGPFAMLRAVLEGAPYDAFLLQDADDWSAPDRHATLLAASEATGAEMMGSQVTVLLMVGLGASTPACIEAAFPSKADVKCVKEMHAGGRKVASAQQALQRGCVVAEAKAKLPDADACIAADESGRVEKATAKLVAADTRTCATPPLFAYVDAATVAEAAVAQVEGLARDLLDDATGLAVATAAADAKGAACQQKMLNAVDALLRVSLARFAACTGKSIGMLESAAELRDACLGALASERSSTDGKLAKAARKVEQVRGKACAQTALAAAFPGACASQAGGAFDVCVEERAACRACRLLDAMAGLGADCELFDDGVGNGSCASPATSSTATSTSSTTSTSIDGSSSTTTSSSSTSSSTSTVVSSSTTSSTTTSMPPPEPFAIAIGDTVSDGVPAPGAGRIETPGALDVYVFEAAASQRIFFDEGALAGTEGVPYRITDEDGAVVASDGLGGFEPGVLVLARGGTYTITVGSPLAVATGTYGFTLWGVPAPDTFAIALDQAVSDGVPAAGAGNVEAPGARDVYTFDANAGAVVYLDEQSVAASVNGLAYTLLAPGASVLLVDGLGGFEPGRITLSAGIPPRAVALGRRVTPRIVRRLPAEFCWKVTASKKPPWTPELVLTSDSTAPPRRSWRRGSTRTPEVERVAGERVRPHGASAQVLRLVLLELARESAEGGGRTPEGLPPGGFQDRARVGAGAGWGAGRAQASAARTSARPAAARLTSARRTAAHPARTSTPSGPGARARVGATHGCPLEVSVSSGQLDQDLTRDELRCHAVPRRREQPFQGRVGDVAARQPQDSRRRAVSLEQVNEVDVLRRDDDIGNPGFRENRLIGGLQESEVHDVRRCDSAITEPPGEGGRQLGSIHIGGSGGWSGVPAVIQAAITG
jgi:hypothetical protein